MTSTAETRKSTPRKRDAQDERPVEASVDAQQGSCKLPGCPFDATTRGLCDAHWCTHRGLADELPAVTDDE